MRVQSVAFSLTITLCLALAAAGLAFVAGRTAANPEGRYEQGVEEGERLGRTQTRADYAQGSDGYRAIFDRGRVEGARSGRDAERRVGTPRLVAAGRNKAFAGFEGGWSIGRWYLVNIRPGDGGAKYAIGARMLVRSGNDYRVCRRVSICRKRVRTTLDPPRRVAGSDPG
ncbi:MAG: hypothetical protein AVDCRST_MAG85-756 [uncultured Solirubrobacteraceae bacterium]|uniref:Uncharacterized protein n=1 Tax=uncultured Solirubrobacteraceae bacterium TaxID=1162706 RepID=A0A6J4S0X0_9ACTN|nr:MAG: hypothetical protein AVDCRST_MAG85-756 [uncultured Solirubrobacteraceae bacterium]